MGSPLKSAISLLLFSPLLLASPAFGATIEKTFTLGPVHVNQIYPSMTGPLVEQNVQLEPESKSQQLWIQSFRVEAADEHGPIDSLEYLCHASAETKRKDLFTISQGLADMEFPQGFAFPIPNSPGEPLTLQAQALNNNEKVNKQIRFIFTIGYVDQEEATRLELKPLRFVSANAFGPPAKNHSHHHGGMSGDSSTRKLSEHFSVPPGEHTYTSKVADFPRDARIHFIKMHLHPSGESISLWDKTANKLVWKGNAKNHPTRSLLLFADSYSSQEGLQIYKDHHYEISTTYRNKTKKTLDGMAHLRMYIN